ncbi:hypothetical protein [Oleisolibacter albus]|uniref:hypothetical protein n=1 Tax=Oleisolibacter albus TaxID=2171757 RepID=UPI000DF168D5|nr:hypothetical protein [Oleisolibacter albus]
MPIYEFAPDRIQPLTKTTFGAMQLHERRDLQRLLRENIAVIAPDTLVIAEEYGEWDDSRRRIDLLGIDRDANLVVIELKRTEDGGHMELQAIRYAAMVSTMTFDQAVAAFDRYLRQIGRDDADARGELLAFLGWDESDHDQFAQEVKIVLASAEFSLELTTAVLWLNQRDLDIRCVRLQPYNLSGQVLVDVQQIIPPPEAAEYQVRVREKVRKEREARTSGADHTKYDLRLGQQEFPRESKRWAILRTFRYLVESGIAPETVAKHCGPRANRALRSVEGEVGHDDFVRLATKSRAELGKRFDPIRWFCGDDELLRVGGRTYAFSSQWGGDDWLEAMTNLRDAFPDRGIVFTPAG